MRRHPLPALGSFLAFLLAFLLALPAAASGVVVADDPQTQTLQALIDAAAEGDTLLVGPGEWDPFTIDGKSRCARAAPASEGGVHQRRRRTLCPRGPRRPGSRRPAACH